MPDQPHDPQALLARLAHCLATPTTSTIGDYFDAEQLLDEYCHKNSATWGFDDDGMPYLEKAGHRARRLVEGIAEFVSRETEMVPVTTTLEGMGGIVGYLIKSAPCGHDLIVMGDIDVWLDGVSYCTNQGCGAGYTLVFGDDGELIGVEPFGR